MAEASGNERIRQQQPLFALLTASLGISFALLALYIAVPLLPQRHLYQVLFYAIFLSLSLGASLLHFILVRTAPVGEIGVRSLRQSLILAFLAYALFSLASAASVPDCFLPGFANIAGVMAVIVSVIIDYWFRSLLFSRQTIYSLIAENRPESLLERFSKQQEIVFEAFNDIMVLRQASTALLVIGILLTMVLNYLSLTGFATSITVLVFLASCFGLITLANTYAEEHRFYLFGVATPFRYQRIRQDWAYACLAVCLLLACLVAGDRSPLDVRLIAGFLAWLADLFPNQIKAQPADWQEFASTISPPKTPDLAAAMTQSLNLDLWWLPWLFIFLKCVGIAAALAGIAWFLAKPLFERGFNPLLSLLALWQRIRAFFGDSLSRLCRFLRLVVDFLRVHLRPLPDATERPVSRREYIDRLLKTGRESKGSNDRNQHRQSLQTYAEFLDWALGLGVMIRLADTPGDIAETTKRLVADLIEHEQVDPALITIDRLTAKLEQDLFARNHLSKPLLEEMRQDCSLLKMSRRRAASS
jgi:hypothetical protein